MKKFFWLQMFAEEGGDAGASAPTETATNEAPTGAEDSSAQMDSMMARIPERAKGLFKDAYKETHPKATEVVEEQPQEPPAHIPYAELIKSDEYKAEHKAYMDETISKRFKGYDGIKEQNAKMQEALGIVAQKYGLDANAPDFIDSLSQKISADNSYYEEYALEHDMSVEDAKRNLQMEKKIRDLEAQEMARRQEAENAEAMRQLMANAEKTKQMFPGFDLDTEMQNEQFRRMLFATGGDTSAAYQALHWKEIIPQRVAIETAKVKQAVTNSIVSGQNRPMESGLSKSPAATINMTPSLEGMTSSQMREWGKKNLRKR